MTMTFWGAWQTALGAITRNTLRSLLAVIGIVIAVMAVIGTSALGEGAKTRTAKEMARLGTNLLFVTSASAQVGGARGGAGTGNSLTLEDGKAIGEQLTDVVALVAPTLRANGQVIYGAANWSTSIMGTTPAYLDAYNRTFKEGVGFSEADAQLGTKRCVLGSRVAQELFGARSPLGEQVRIRQMACTIVGVLEPKGSGGFGPDQDDMVLVPLATFTRRLQPLKQNKGVNLVVSARTAELAPEVEREVRVLLRQRHRLAAEAKDDVLLFNLSELQRSALQQMQTLSWLLFGIALISLVVGAIGVANIMLIAVTERTKEIGLRMAVGATGRDILVQFMMEAVALSLAGAGVGLALGIGFAQGLTHWAHWPATVHASSAAFAVGAAALTGVVAGLYPAWRASKLDPITALRAD